MLKNAVFTIILASSAIPSMAGDPPAASAQTEASPSASDLAGVALDESVVILEEMRAGTSPEPPRGVAGGNWWKEEYVLLGRNIHEQYSSTDSTGTLSAQSSSLVGKSLPSMRLVGPTGRLVDLANLRGERRLALFYLRAEGDQPCLGCTVQTVVLTQNITRFEELGTEVVLVYPGSADRIPSFLDAVEEFHEGFRVQIPILLDVEGEMRELLSLAEGESRPAAVIVDKEGKITHAHVGKTFDDRPSVGELLAALGPGPVAP